MHAVFIEVNADESHIATAHEQLPKTVVPMAQQAGAKSGYWLAPKAAAASPSSYSTPKTTPATWPPR